ncbi:hypothetical protein FHS39_003522 [Streptomyces olivoverticillatus]|uniref:Uncharacterized protein n=1 Tax=Streptomyces olivoverticillatus TaxID=66427 RepID=A0A7W7LQM6_9ACTN|nr:hypothetical protein [Streptomyces olivoverticillatus]MBB4894464.1 hypothetical protein [Streptomyces olivoverticillatus]
MPDPDAVSYSRDIRPLFTDLDVTHMREFGIFLDDYAFMSVPVNAESAYFQVSHRLMPPPDSGEDAWPTERIHLLRDWIDGGLLP